MRLELDLEGRVDLANREEEEGIPNGDLARTQCRKQEHSRIRRHPVWLQLKGLRSTLGESTGEVGTGQIWNLCSWYF